MRKSLNSKSEETEDVITAKELHRARIDKILAQHADSPFLPTGKILEAEFNFQKAQKRRK